MVNLSPIKTAGDLAPPLSVTASMNHGLPVHDWYLIPESYSEPLVERAIKKFDIGSNDTILDPFSGSGTTVITAALNGVNGVGLEVNPFLCFASQTKLDWDVDLAGFSMSLKRVLQEAQPLLDSLSAQPDLATRLLPPGTIDKAHAILSELQEPAMPRLYKWMTKVVAQKILIFDYLIGLYVPARLRAHFLLALAAILRPASNMKLTAHAFGSNTQKADAPVYELFTGKITKIYDDLLLLRSLDTKFGRASIVHTDSRNASAIKGQIEPVSLAITSPPYLNNLDYTMQTRLELFFLRFVNSMDDLRNLRKAMVICDAKAMYKDVKDSERVSDVRSIQAIASNLQEAHKDKNWGWDYAFMTTQYFGGILRVLEEVKPLLRHDARFVLIVGESAHSGIRIPLPEILAELGERAGYRFEQLNTLRCRRSSSHKHDLREVELVLRYHG